MARSPRVSTRVRPLGDQAVAFGDGFTGDVTLLGDSGVFYPLDDDPVPSSTRFCPGS